MNALSTRLAAPDDLATLAALFDAYRQFYQQAPDLPRATQFIADRLHDRQSILLVATATDDSATQPLLGFCQIYPSFCSILAQPIYILSDLYVTPAARRSGAGRQLLLGAGAHARQHGVARLDLTTARSNQAAQALYESLGWKRDHIFLAYSRSVA